MAESDETGPGFGPQWLAWAQRLAAIAQNGLAYVKDPFDRERYEQVRAVAAEILAGHTGASAEIAQGLLSRESGYATPKLDARAAVFRDNAILLVREASDGGWTLPGGWVDVGDSPSTAVEREVLEESGYCVKASRLLAVWDRNRHPHPPLAYHVWKLVVQCELLDPEPVGLRQEHETLDVGFFAEDDLPPLSLTRILPEQIARLFELHCRRDLPADFD